MPAKKKPKATPAQALLDAHVAFYLARIRSEQGLAALLVQWLDLFLEEAATLTLDDAISRDTIKATARTYAIELDPGPGIPELIGEIAQRLHAHPVHDHTELGELLPQARFEDLLAYALAQRSVRARLVRGFVASPLYEQIVSELLYNGIRDYLARSTAASHIPGARSALKLGRAVVGLAGGALERAAEDSIKQYIARSVGSVSERTAQSLIAGAHDPALFDAAAASWRGIRKTRVGELRQDLSALELEELFVTLYEWWKQLRQTPFIAAMIDAGIDGFFDKYGPTPLAELLADIGIDRARMLAEAQRFAPEVLSRLDTQGRLQGLLRRGLAPFYESGEVEAVLAALKT